MLPTYRRLACLVIWAPCGNATAGTAPPATGVVMAIWPAATNIMMNQQYN